MLLDSPGAVVNREELQRQLWPDAISGDFEHGLNAAVNKLRQALSDSAGQPRYIETIPGQGYRFVAPVEFSPRPLLEITRPIAAVPEPPKRFKRWWAIGVLPAVGILAFAAGYAVHYSRALPAAAVQSTRFVLSPPAGFFLEGAGARQSLAISPDGTHVAFTAVDDSGLFRVFLRPLKELEPRQVPDSIGAHSVFWSPDSSSLLFTAQGKLRRTRVFSDSTQVLADSIPGMVAGTWLPSGRYLLSSRFRSALMPAGGGHLEPLKDTYTWPQLLPGGQNVLHVVFDPQLSRYRARVARFGDPGSAKDLVESDSKAVYVPGYLLYVRAGTLLAHPFDAGTLRLTGEPTPVARGVCSFLPGATGDFSVANSGVLVYQACVPHSQLIWADRLGRRISAASTPDLALKAARLSPDRRHIGTSVYDVDRGVTDVWLFNADGSGGRQVTSGPGLSHSPVWSPDSKSLVFSRANGSTPKLFVRAVDDHKSEQALTQAGFQMPTDWSPDGRFILYNNTGQTLVANEEQGDIWAVDLERGRQLIPLVQTPFHEANGVFSPDGRWLAYTSNESGRTEVYLQKIARGDSLRVSGERHLVSQHGAQCLRWRSDGRELFYLGRDGQVYAVPMKLQPNLSIGPPSALFRISAEARAAIHAVLGFDVSADGKKFVIPVVSSGEKPSLVVVQNWQSLLAERRD